MQNKDYIIFQIILYLLTFFTQENNTFLIFLFSIDLTIFIIKIIIIVELLYEKFLKYL